MQTRLRKLDEGVVDATLLAYAGLKRMDMADEATAVLEWEEMLPAVAQGAIGIQCRDDDERALRYIDALNHEETFTCVSCERAFLAALDGNCKTPIAGQAQIIDGELRFQGLVASVDGSKIYRSSKVGAPADAEKIGREAGEEIKAEAGIEFFEWLQQQEEPAAVSAWSSALPRFPVSMMTLELRELKKQVAGRYFIVSLGTPCWLGKEPRWFFKEPACLGLVPRH